MLTLGATRSTMCQGVDRRSLLRLGGLGLFGLGLPELLRAEGQAPAQASGGAPTSGKAKNCILLWMGGGASNIDTFDLKLSAPAEIRGEFQPIDSKIPGLPVCEHLPLMAQRLDRVCLIRSVAHPESGDHTAAHHYMLTGYPQRPDPSGQPAGSLIYPAYGSVVSKELGWREAMPPYVMLSGEPNPYGNAGHLGSAFNPLAIKNDPNDPKFNVQDVAIPGSIGGERTQRRRGMLAALDRWQRAGQSAHGPVAERNRFYEQAYDLITSPAAKKAFDLSQEPDSVRDRYGRHRFGQATLLARRLIEAGVRFVAMETNWWDTHQFNFRDLKGSRLPNLDLFWSALLDDLQERGLLESTLVIWMGEFGRTPTINGSAGRDHWAWTNVIGLSGAGIRHGAVVGQTDRKCERVVGNPHSTHDLAATIYQLLGIDGNKEYMTPDGRPVLVNYHGQPILEALA